MSRNYSQTERCVITLGRLCGWSHSTVKDIFKARDQKQINKLKKILKDNNVDTNMSKNILNDYQEYLGRDGKSCNIESYDGHGKNYLLHILGKTAITWTPSNGILEYVKKVPTLTTLKLWRDTKSTNLRHGANVLNNIKNILS